MRSIAGLRLLSATSNHAPVIEKKAHPLSLIGMAGKVRCGITQREAARVWAALSSIYRAAGNVEAVKLDLVTHRIPKGIAILIPSTVLDLQTDEAALITPAGTLLTVQLKSDSADGLCLHLSSPALRLLPAMRKFNRLTLSVERAALLPFAYLRAVVRRVDPTFDWSALVTDQLQNGEIVLTDDLFSVFGYLREDGRPSLRAVTRDLAKLRQPDVRTSRRERLSSDPAP